MSDTLDNQNSTNVLDASPDTTKQPISVLETYPKSLRQEILDRLVIDLPDDLDD